MGSSRPLYSSPAAYVVRRDTAAPPPRTRDIDAERGGTDDDRRRERQGVEAVHRPGVAAPAADVVQRGGIACVIALRAVRHANVVQIARWRTRLVGAGKNPRRDVTLGERATHRPVAIAANRRTDRQVRNAAREAVGREQLIRAVERSGRQQIELTREGRPGEEIRREPRRRA